MLIDLLFCYVAGGISCGMVCTIMQYMDRKHVSGRLNRDDVITLGAIFVFTFMLWPVLITACIVMDIREKFMKKK